MRFKFSIVILILISFFNIGAFSENLVNEYSFNELENLCFAKNKFVENGVKVQYKTNIDKDTEEKKITNYFKEIGLNEKSSDKLNYVNDALKVEADIWNDKLYTYVNVTLINTDVSYKTLELQNIVGKLIDKNSKEVQYFCYYKGKTDDIEKEYNTKILEKIMSESILKKADILEVHNGYTGNVVLKDSQKINFAITRYDTGTYLIVGTPVIFAAY
ncbi:MAG: hypothetical protein E7207_01460 [Clostridium butyricum]|nr:hypothetical protein [Clostridium butyricum]